MGSSIRLSESMVCATGSKVSVPESPGLKAPPTTTPPTITVMLTLPLVTS